MKGETHGAKKSAYEGANMQINSYESNKLFRPF